MMNQEIESTKFIVRGYDKYDGWYDCTGPISYDEALKKWNQETANGTKHTEYPAYFKIFPADTQMIWRSEIVDP